MFLVSFMGVDDGGRTGFGAGDGGVDVGFLGMQVAFRQFEVAAQGLDGRRRGGRVGPVGGGQAQQVQRMAAAQATVDGVIHVMAPGLRAGGRSVSS